MSPELMDLVQSLGFPVVACGAMALFIKQMSKEHREDRKEDRKERAIISEEASAATSKLAEAVTELRISIAKDSL